MFRITNGQSSYAQCSIRPKYLKYYTPSTHSSLSSPVRQKVTPVQFSAIVTSLIRHLIYEKVVLIRITVDILHMTGSRSGALQNGYLKTLIIWYNIYISPNNKQNSNIVIFVKKLYVTFICTLHYNTVSNH